MKRRRLLFVAFTFAVVLTLLTMSLALAQSGAEESSKGVESSAPPSGIPRLTGGPDAFGYVYADSNEASCTTTFNDISMSGFGLGLSDDGEGTVSSPFPISLYDVTSTTLRIGNNGALVVGSTTGSISAGNGALPSTSSEFANNPSVLPFWEDLDSDSGDVYTDVVGTAPNRQFIVQWHDRNRFNSGNVISGTATLQVVFYENSRKIDFVYQDVEFGNPDWDYGNGATIGLNQNGSNALQYSFNSPSILTGTNPVSAICFDRIDSISLAKTVGTNPAVCATEDSIGVLAGTTVYYCYNVTSNAATTRSLHTLVDSEFGSILTNFPFDLAPGASVWLTESAVITTTTVNTATWTAFNPNTRADELMSTDTATVNVLGLTCPTGQTVVNAYSSDFETDNGGGVGSLDWAWGTLSPTFPAALAGAGSSGTNVWATVLDGPYNNLGASSLLTFTVDLTGIAAPVGLNWQQYLQAAGSGFDKAKIFANGTMVYDSTGIPDETAWTLHDANLDAQAGGMLTLVFSFTATTVVNDEGWYVDDLAVQYCQAATAVELSQSDLQVDSTASIVAVVTIMAVGLTGLLLVRRREDEMF